MAVLEQSNHQPSGVQRQAADTNINSSQKAQWMRSAIEGLLFTASLMMGVGALKEDKRAMVLSGFAGLIAGTSNTAIRKFFRVYWQVGIEVAQMKREEYKGEVKLSSTVQVALLSALAFSVAAMVPILAAAFITPYKVRLAVVVGAVSLALMVLGVVGAKLGRVPVVRSCVRLLVGGWLAMFVTFGLMKLFESHVL
ncbi:vacuolar iron transporter homolog 4-like [Magnolia sinica]|uniref:vacuolar iron transporter homolog 4-like n=1 Tax=Magnolia sinica TaxID=86752 RepID=UPI00265A5130|nr:vacuolar iron transporter homolog 4-like [Magnolia sinica]